MIVIALFCACIVFAAGIAVLTYLSGKIVSKVSAPIWMFFSFAFAVPAGLLSAWFAISVFIYLAGVRS